MTHKEWALDYFGKKMHCSQAVIAAYADRCGITKEQAFKLGSCFGSGMRKGEVCGACTGALMVLGLMFGQDTIGDTNARERSNMVNDLMMNRFKEVCGSCICNDLLGCDVSTPQGAKYAFDNKLFTEFCPKMVANAVDILEEIIGKMAEN